MVCSFILGLTRVLVLGNERDIWGWQFGREMQDSFMTIRFGCCRNGSVGGGVALMCSIVLII